MNNYSKPDYLIKYETTEANEKLKKKTFIREKKKTKIAENGHSKTLSRLSKIDINESCNELNEMNFFKLI